MRTKAEAMVKPLAGDRWRKGGDDWAEKGCLLTVERWEGTSGVFNQGGLMSEMFLCNWHDDLISKFRRWATNAEYLGGTA